MRRTLITIGTLAFSLIFYGGISRLLVVRGAIEAGVFARPGTCVSKRDREQLASKPLNPARRDYYLAREIQIFENGYSADHDQFWRLRTIGNKIALRVWYSDAARQSMLVELQSHQRLCRFAGG